MTKQNATNKRWIIPVFFIVIIIPAIWFLFLNKASDFDRASNKLTDSWLRSDGTYTIEIKEVRQENNLIAFYFNPKPINVATAVWGVQDGKLNIQIGLNDVNYRGSSYNLTYDEKSGQLIGTYYLASTKQSYDVIFNRK